MLLVMNTTLGSCEIVNMENAFDAHCINQYIAYIPLYVLLGTFNQISPFAKDSVFQIGVCRHAISDHFL